MARPPASAARRSAHRAARRQMVIRATSAKWKPPAADLRELMHKDVIIPRRRPRRRPGGQGKADRFREGPQRL